MTTTTGIDRSMPAAPFGRAAALGLTAALGLAAVLGLAPPAHAQVVSPYAGEEARAIKALSEDEVREYLEGEGMGWAMAAELNHYPGPRHAIDLADSLGLSAVQRDSLRDIHGRMNARAVELGSTIVAREADLDGAFAEGTIDAAELDALVAEIAELQGRLRSTHLMAHLETRAALSPHQVAMYDRLRGYGGGADHADHAH
ncbi:MAG TPA: periplasmic heavy metal sensor [Gemmatimonadota bacterium]|nr:periplasmic heavy metal sensor [Gemmatimonadota bacterium]